MSRKVITIKKDGFLFERHTVAINNGKTKVGDVDVFAPKNLDDLQNGIEKGLDNEQHAVSLYTRAKAVEMQQQARAAKTGGKIPQADIARIFSSISAADKQKLSWGELMIKITEIYRGENITT